MTSSSLGSGALVKRQKPESNANNGAISITNGKSRSGSSKLLAPVMELSGHNGEIFAARFDPIGNLIASGSMDRSILLWQTYGDCKNYGQLIGHKGAILDLQWSRDSQYIYSASADMIIGSWDAETGTRVRRHQGHEDVINTIDVSRRGEEIIVSGSDDGYIGLWDCRQKLAVGFIYTDFPVTAIALSSHSTEIFSGSIDNEIKAWDLRQLHNNSSPSGPAPIYTLSGHNDTITSLRISLDTQSLLSNSHDSTVRTWDIRPFAPASRLVKTYDGAPTGIERNLLKANWDKEGKRIVAGSGDGTAVVWDTYSTRMLAKVPGHRGAVNDVSFAPAEESAILSASSDRVILLGELTLGR